MRHRTRLAQALVLEIIVGLLIILGVVLLVASLFPTSYQASLQAARMTAALNLARQVLERQKANPAATPLNDQVVDQNFEVQGRVVQAHFIYRVDLETIPDADPRIWTVEIRWLDGSQTKDLVLSGAVANP